MHRHDIALPQRHLTPFFLLCSALFIAACDTAQPPSPDVVSSSRAAPSVTPTGTTISVDMVTDEKGNYYAPEKIVANRGDVIRFVLVSGVHNVHFLADSNPGTQNLPATSDYLQLPGQTWDLLVNLDPGVYYYHCDPHALLGMIGHIEVK